MLFFADVHCSPFSSASLPTTKPSGSESSRVLVKLLSERKNPGCVAFATFRGINTPSAAEFTGRHCRRSWEAGNRAAHRPRRHRLRPLIGRSPELLAPNESREGQERQAMLVP